MKRIHTKTISIFLAAFMILMLSTVFPPDAAASFSTEPMVAVGGGHTLALRSDGTVLAWGRNFHGQLGDGTTTDRHVPVQVQGINNAIYVAALGSTSFAVLNDGTVWIWGWDDLGRRERGVNPVVTHLTPVQVQGISNITALYAIDSQWSFLEAVTALRGDGTVWVWGNLDLSSGLNITTPTQVQNLYNITAISRQLAVRSDGTVWSWREVNGSPYQVQGLEEILDASSSRVSGLGNYALKRDGSVFAWGIVAALYQFNDGVNFPSVHRPQQVNVIQSIVSLSLNMGADWGHVYALRADGTVFVWGNSFVIDRFGRSGNFFGVPTQIQGLNNVVAISSNQGNAAAIKSDGTVWTWMWDVHGELGDRTVTLSPEQVAGPGGVGFLNLNVTTVTAPPHTPPTALPINVLLDDIPLTFDVPPQIIDGRTLVPLRAIFEALGADVDWNSATQTVIANRANTEIILTIGDSSPTINGQVVSIDQPGVIIDGRTLVPLRFVGEALGADVNWDQNTRTVNITN